MAGVLADVRVIDLTTGMAGAIAGMILADNGAEVIKIEPPGGDPLRAWDASLVWHRGKRSVYLDIRQPAGRDALLRLLATADVLIENLPAGEAGRLGLDYPALKDRFPRLVYCTISGYVDPKEDAARPAYGELVEARLGLHSEQRGYRPGPIFLGWPHASWGAAFTTDLGILAALFRQRLSGRGQHVQTSLEEGIAALSTNRWILADAFPPLPQTTPAAMARRQRAIIGHFQCQDGKWLSVHTMARGAFNRLMRTVGLPEWVDETVDPQYEMAQQMDAADLQRLWVELTAVFFTRPRDTWVEILREAEMPVEPVLDRGEAFRDPQIQAIEMAVTLDDPIHGPVTVAGVSQKFGRTPAPPLQRLASPPGADTEAVLRESGFTPEEIEALHAGRTTGAD